MHRSLPILAAALLGLTAGWFLRGAPEKPPEKKSSIAATPAVASAKAPAAKSPSGTAAAWTSADSKAGPQPFTSLEELIAAVDGIDMEDEMGFVEMFNGVPRLLCTDLATTRRLLTELEGSDRPQGEGKGILAISLLARWMMQEPEGAIEFGKSHPGVFGTSPDGNMMQEFTMMGIMMAAKKSPEAARSLVEMLPKDDQEEARDMLMMVEAAHDPEGTLKALPPDKSENASTILGLWARRDPQAALQWASSQPEDDQENFLKAVAEGWAKKDWKGAAQWAVGLPADGGDRGEVYSAIASAIAKSLPAGADQSATQATLAGVAQPIADRVLLALESNGSKADDQQASAARIMEILKRNAADTGFQAEASGTVLNIAKTWASTDGAAAAAWVQSLPPSPAQDSAIESIAGAWAENDSAAASAWIGTLPAGKVREKATTELIEKLAGSDPEHALTWAKSLTDAGQRTEQIGKVLREWLPEDPFAAMKAIESLPANLRDEIWEKDAP